MRRCHQRGIASQANEDGRMNGCSGVVVEIDTHRRNSNGALEADSRRGSRLLPRNKPPTLEKLILCCLLVSCLRLNSNTLTDLHSPAPDAKKEPRPPRRTAASQVVAAGGGRIKIGLLPSVRQFLKDVEDDMCRRVDTLLIMRDRRATRDLHREYGAPRRSARTTTFPL